ncbi:Spy/CpxP family protein refolding chaperone [Pulveribacter sp.]|uniref:Spy/CpxP family protein refolding chaperone n=1 Tax=Pulveribacter sp. TaxID=2678893 RepID=UPI0028A6C2F9|nr:Spy/CpxP family protein refolding chaperone [Pulveribacter sp.]
MTRTRTTLAAAACATLLALAGTPAMAQTAAPASATAAATSQTADAAPQARQRHAMTPEQRQQARAQRAEAFKQKLALTPAQEPAWAAFQQAMQPGQQHARLDRGQRQDWKQLTTPERIDRMRALQAQRAAAFDRRAEAVKTFYATLNAEQQKTFDAEGSRMMARFGKGGRHGMHGHKGMHHGEHHAQHRGAQSVPQQQQPMPQ